jgi:hypothetical protein
MIQMNSSCSIERMEQPQLVDARLLGFVEEGKASE